MRILNIFNKVSDFIAEYKGFVSCLTIAILGITLQVIFLLLDLDLSPIVTGAIVAISVIIIVTLLISLIRDVNNEM